MCLPYSTRFCSVHLYFKISLNKDIYKIIVRGRGVSLLCIGDQGHTVVYLVHNDILIICVWTMNYFCKLGSG